MSTITFNSSELLETLKEFKLGHLETENFHPLSKGLAEKTNANLIEGYKTLKEIDLLALQKMKTYLPLLDKLFLDIKSTLENGDKVYLVGCGATGRLSLALEFLWKNNREDNNDFDNVRSFMAGGDVALINSIEDFEDHKEFGARQLKDAGFKNNDLLIGPTEGGETSFVIGAVEEAAKLSSRKPYLLYCNPDDQLSSIKRSNDIIQNSEINTFSLFVGAMAISGSTRMQASTVLMWAIGVCLLKYINPDKSLALHLDDLISTFDSIEISSFSQYTKLELEAYNSNELVNYISNQNSGIHVLTDTTERSPTFSLTPFENQNDDNSTHSLCYLFLQATKTTEEAWTKLLKRKPRPLNWENYYQRVSLDRLLGFDISEDAKIKRKNSHPFYVSLIRDQNSLKKNEMNTTYLDFTFKEQKLRLTINNDDSIQLKSSLILKMILNTHSTLLMCLYGRVKSNIMTHVRPSNLKLIDRTIRYVQILLKEDGKDHSYEDIIKQLCAIKVSKDDRPIVLELYNHFKSK